MVKTNLHLLCNIMRTYEYLFTAIPVGEWLLKFHRFELNISYIFVLISGDTVSETVARTRAGMNLVQEHVIILRACMKLCSD